MKDVSGQADATAKTMDAGVGGSFRLFQSAIEGAMNATGEALNSTIKLKVERITAVINSFTKWIEANKGLVASIAVTAGSIAALVAALLMIGTVSRVLSTGIGALSGVFSAFAGVQTALAAKVVVVQGAFSLVAAGCLAASAAATAFCAIPITWVLIGVVAALGGLCAYMASATKHTFARAEGVGLPDERNAPAAKRPGWVRAKPELRSSRKAPR